jgi:hypothetical protein
MAHPSASDASSAAACPSRQAYRWRLLSVAATGTLLLAIILAGCTFSPSVAPAQPAAPYPCAPTPCANTVTIDPLVGLAPDLQLTSVSTDMDVVPLACDPACQASTGVPATGNVINYIALFDASATHFIRIGYMVNAGRDVYFYQAVLPGQAPSFQTPLGETEIGPGYPDTYTNTGMLISEQRNAGGGGHWYLTFTLRHAAQMGGMGVHTYAVTGPSFALSSFAPRRMVMGQTIFGHSGVTAQFASFDNIQYSAVSTVHTCLPPATTCAYSWGAVTQDGTVAGQPTGSVPPPYAGWLFPPSRARNNAGGVFYTECCRPPDISLFGP